MRTPTAELPPPISPAEMTERRAIILAAAAKHGSDCFVAFDPTTIFYFSGYAFVPTERPVALLIDAAGDAVLWVPLLKARHAELSTQAKVEAYPEYPDRAQPMRGFAAIVRARGGRKAAADLPGYASIQGYHADCFGEADTVLAPLLAERLRMVKSPAEQALIGAGCAWSGHAHWLLQEAVRPGVVESSVAGRATGAAMSALRQAMVEAPRPPRPFRIFAGFGGQVGADGTAHHHQVAIDPTLTSGDLLITQVGAVIGGYHSELERTMVVGTPSAEVRELFLAGEEMQAHAIDLIRPGVACAEVDAALHARFEQAGLEAYWKHHTGHAVGLCPHEAPFIDIGDTTILEPGMVVTAEPGLYRDGVGGFRHSDCVLVTEHGRRVLTDHPRDLASLSGL